MDPNANLAELRELVQCITERLDADNGDLNPFDYHRDTGRELSADVARACELFAALDEWLVKGGFLPDRWLNPACDAIVKELPNLTITVTAEERKEARQALVYEKALKFVREVAGSHYLPESMATVDSWTANTIDRARVINREAQEAWT